MRARPAPPRRRRGSRYQPISDLPKKNLNNSSSLFDVAFRTSRCPVDSTGPSAVGCPEPGPGGFDVHFCHEADRSDPARAVRFQRGHTQAGARALAVGHVGCRGHHWHRHFRPHRAGGRRQCWAGHRHLHGPGRPDERARGALLFRVRVECSRRRICLYLCLCDAR